LAFQSYIIAIAENPDTLENVSIVPTDDYEARNKSFEIMEKVKGHYNLFLRQLIADNPTNIPTAVRNLRELQRKMSLGEVDDQKVETLLSEKFSDEKVRSAAGNYLFDMKRIFFPGGDLFEKRNDITVSRSLAQSGNGLILMGFYHEPGIKNRFTTFCQEGSH